MLSVRSESISRYIAFDQVIEIVTLICHILSNQFDLQRNLPTLLVTFSFSEGRSQRMSAALHLIL